MRKNKLSIVVILLSLVFSFALLGCNGGAVSPYQSVYYSAYGEWLTLPVNDGATVKSADGKEIAIENNRVFFDKVGDYSLTLKKNGNEYTSKIVVQKGAAPMIFPSRQMEYATVGEKVELDDLATATARDAVGELTVTKKMYFGNTEVDITNGFTPTEKGEYKLVFSATTGGGVEGKYEVSYYTEESESDYANIIAAFDKPFGSKQIALPTETWYSTDIAFDDEAGSTAVKFMTKRELYKERSVHNLYQVDISNYDAIYFYAYHDGKDPVTIMFGWGGKAVRVYPKQWTRVAVTAAEYEKSFIKGGYADQKGDISLENIDGFHIIFKSDPRGMNTERNTLYLSAMRGINAISAEEVQALVDAEIIKSEVNSVSIGKVVAFYDMLSTEDKKQIEGIEVLKTRIARKEVEDLGYTYIDNKVLYFDEEIGVTQAADKFSAALSYDTEVLYNGEPTLQVKCNSTDTCFVVERSYVYELDDYDVFNLSVYNPTDQRLMLYGTDRHYAGLYNKDYWLAPKAWTTVFIPVNEEREIEGRHFWIRHESWDKDSVMKGKKFNFSAMYAYSFADAVATLNGDYTDFAQVEALLLVYNGMSEEKKELNESTAKALYTALLNLAVDNGEYDYDRVVSAINIYSNFGSGLAADTKAITVTAYDGAVAQYLAGNDFSDKQLTADLIGAGELAPRECLDSYYDLLETAVTIKDGDTLVAFGQSKVELTGDIANFSVDYTTAKAYGTDAGSTVFTVRSWINPEYPYLEVMLPEIDELFVGTESMKISVYWETTVGEAVDFRYRTAPWGRKGVEGKAGTLVPNQWNEITLSLMGAQKMDQWLFIFGWSGLSLEDKLYFSSLTVSAPQSVERGTFVVPFAEKEIELNYDHATVNRSYTTDKAFGAEAGSTVYEITGWENTENKYIEMFLPHSNIPLRKGDFLKFKVYYESTGSTELPFIIRTGAWGSAGDEMNTGILKKNAWTEVYLDLNGKTDISNWVMIFGYSGLNIGDKLYFGNVEAVSSPYADDDSVLLKTYDIINGGMNGIKNQVSFAAGRNQNLTYLHEFEGKTSVLRFKCTGNAAGLEFNLLTNRTFTGTEKIKFFAYYEGTNADFAFNCVPCGEWSKIGRQFYTTLNAGVWTEITIDLATISLDGQPLNSVAQTAMMFEGRDTFQWKTGDTVYITDMTIVD